MIPSKLNNAVMLLSYPYHHVRYQNKVNLFADMWRDQDRPGFDEAIYWIELLIKYGNFQHLQINDHDLNILQYLSVDVVFAYILIILLTMMILWKTLIICLSRISLSLNTRVDRLGGHRQVSVTATVTIRIYNMGGCGSFYIKLFEGG